MLVWGSVLGSSSWLAEKHLNGEIEQQARAAWQPRVFSVFNPYTRALFRECPVIRGIDRPA